jgi:hypothetical protein
LVLTNAKTETGFAKAVLWGTTPTNQILNGVHLAQLGQLHLGVGEDVIHAMLDNLLPLLGLRSAQNVAQELFPLQATLHASDAQMGRVSSFMAGLRIMWKV